MSKQRCIENVELGKRLFEIQNMYGKSDEYMACLTGYTVHTYQCVRNGDQSISISKFQKLAQDDQFSNHILYILTGMKGTCDYSIASLAGYIESLPEKRKGTYLADLSFLMSNYLRLAFRDNPSQK